VSSDFTDYLAAQAALESAQADITVAEFHGTFCALMCTRAPVDTRAWVDEIVVHGLPDGTSEDDLWRDCLVEIADLTSAAFVDGECNLEILLPDDDQSLQERSQALVDWCSGFLFGIGLQPAAVCEGLSTDSQEVINDILDFTHMDVSPGVDEDQMGEKSYFELVEYLRVGAMLLYEEIIHGAEVAVADSGPLH